MQRAARIEKEVGQAHGDGIASQRLPLAVGERLEVECFLAEAAFEGFAPGVVAGDGVLRVGGEPALARSAGR